MGRIVGASSFPAVEGRFNYNLVQWMNKHSNLGGKQENDNDSTNWKLPGATLMLETGKTISFSDFLSKKRVIIIGSPGAFLPTCSNRFIPGYRDFMPVLRRVVDNVFCLAVNDPQVLKEWSEELTLPNDFHFISDWDRRLTRSLGLEMDASAYNIGLRCRRFCLLAEHGVIVWIGLEQDAFVDKLAAVLAHIQLITQEEKSAVEARVSATALKTT